jgi:tetraacyldisaccharide 4'-kinase
MSQPAAKPAGLAARLQAAWLERGFVARLLWPVSVLMATTVALHKLLYKLGVLQATQLPVPVVVVGNLIVGGAGKTPTVMAVVELLKQRGFRPGIVSRGYGRHDDSVLEVTATTPASQGGDEPLLLRLRCNVPVWVGRYRAGAAMALLREHPSVNLIVSDDGMQHHRLARDAQVVVFDERGVGNGWLLPAGPLREPLTAQPPQRSVVVYNAARPSTAWPGEMAQRSLEGVVGLSEWWAGKPASMQALQALQSKPVWAAAGMAQPERFFSMLRAAGLQQMQTTPLPDHFDFTTLPWPADTPDVIVTEKDAVKLKPDQMGATSVWVAPLNFALHPASNAALLRLLPPHH